MNNNTPTLPEDPDHLDRPLRESEAHIPDAGFTVRVLVALPPHRRLDPLRLALFTTAWLAGALVLILHAPTIAWRPLALLGHAHDGELAPVLAVALMVLALGSLLWALASWALEEWV